MALNQKGPRIFFNFIFYKLTPQLTSLKMVHKQNKIPYNKGQLCNTLDDEFHFLHECLLYYDLRKSLIDKYYC